MGLFSHDADDDVLVSASFPESNPFGLVVNGDKNGLLLHLANAGSKNYTLVSASSSFHDPTNHWAVLRNASTLKYNVPLVAGANFSAPYSMHSEFRPQELGLTVWVNVVETGTKDVHHITAFNQTVSIVEPQSTWFDGGLLFLYLILLSALAGGTWWAYNEFLAPKTKKKGGKANVKKVKAVVPAESGKQYPDVKPYEEEWIPAHHLKGKAAKLQKGDTEGVSGGGASSGGEEITSGGEATSGAESGIDVKVRRRRGKKA